MVRLIIDNFGGRHKDLLLIIDSHPWHLKVADSYFLWDFLEISDQTFEQLKLEETKALKYAATKLLNYWTDRIKATEKGQAKFLPFDLSDQYVGGLTIEKLNKEFKLKLVWTDKMVGFGVSKSSLDKQITDANITFKDSESAEWLVTEEGMYQGLDWSKKQLVI